MVPRQLVERQEAKTTLNVKRPRKRAHFENDALCARRKMKRASRREIIEKANRGETIEKKLKGTDLKGTDLKGRFGEIDRKSHKTCICCSNIHCCLIFFSQPP